VADLARAGEPAEPVDNVVRSHSLGLVDDDGAIHALTVTGAASRFPAGRIRGINVPNLGRIALVSLRGRKESEGLSANIPHAFEGKHGQLPFYILTSPNELILNEFLTCVTRVKV